MVGMRGQPRIPDALDAGMALEVRRHFLRRAILSLHAHAQSAQAAFQQIGILRVRHATEDSARLAKGRDALATAADHTRQQVVVAGEILGGAVNDEIDPPFQRPLVDRGGEGAVDQGADAVPPGDIDDALQVRHPQVRVGGTLGDDVARLAVAAHRRFQRFIVAHRHHAGLDAQATQESAAELARAPVTVVRHHHVRAAGQRGQQHGGRRVHPRGEEGRVPGAVQRRQATLDGRDCRIAVTSVLLVLDAIAPGLGLHEIDQRLGIGEGVGRRLHDGRGQGIEGLATRRAAVDRARAVAMRHPGRLPLLYDLCHASPSPGQEIEKPGRIRAT